MITAVPDPARVRAIRAAVEWLVEPELWLTAIRRHVPHPDGRCAACQLLAWPCLTWRMAVAARQLCEAREATQ
jgi:hypothetical protein